jgi:hypothetical protein
MEEVMLHLIWNLLNHSHTKLKNQTPKWPVDSAISNGETLK